MLCRARTLTINDPLKRSSYRGDDVFPEALGTQLSILPWPMQWRHFPAEALIPARHAIAARSRGLAGLSIVLRRWLKCSFRFCPTGRMRSRSLCEDGQASKVTLSRCNSGRQRCAFRVRQPVYGFDQRLLGRSRFPRQHLYDARCLKASGAWRQMCREEKG